jgi:hypothetical protein
MSSVSPLSGSGLYSTLRQYDWLCSTPLYNKTAYHTSALTSYAWVQELVLLRPVAALDYKIQSRLLWDILQTLL